MCSVARDEVCAFRPRQLPEGIFQRLAGKCRVEPCQRFAKALGEDDLTLVVTLGRGFAGRDLGAVSDPPADASAR